MNNSRLKLPLAAVAAIGTAVAALQLFAPSAREGSSSLAGAPGGRRGLRVQLRQFVDPRSTDPRNAAALLAPTSPWASDEPLARRPGKRQLVHVFNLYDEGPGSSLSPLGYEQWAMLSSVRSAASAFRAAVSEEWDVVGRAFDSVSVVCAVLESDLSALWEVAARYCDRVSVLERSTATKYPGMNMRSIPFVQDIVDAGVAYATEQQIEEYYLMYTNSDISATLEFYSWLEDYLRNDSHGLGMTVNRMTLDLDSLPSVKSFHDSNGGSSGSFDEKDLMARSFVDEARKLIIDSTADGSVPSPSRTTRNPVESHPGMDCFVFHSSIVGAFDFGDLYIGTSPLSRIRDMMDILLGENRVPRVMSHPHGTFHLGDEQAWRAGMVKGQAFQDTGVIDEWVRLNPGRHEELSYLLRCPDTLEPASLFNLQAYMNCGRLFGPRDDGVPSFVRPGYERIFWENNSEGLDIQALLLRAADGAERRANRRKKLVTKTLMGLRTGEEK